MESIMLSIQPKFCELIANGKKTIEVRKSRPQAEPPFRCYIYCTLPPKQDLFRNGHFLEYANELIRLQNGDIVYEYGMRLLCEQGKYDSDNFLCKKVIGEFICDDIIPLHDTGEAFVAITDYDITACCLNYDELNAYANGQYLYGWHISDLVIYDKPKGLEEFNHPCIHEPDCVDCKYSINEARVCYDESLGSDRRIRRPQQSWCYVEELGGERHDQL